MDEHLCPLTPSLSLSSSFAAAGGDPVPKAVSPGPSRAKPIQAAVQSRLVLGWKRGIHYVLPSESECLAAIRQWDQALRERNEYRETMLKVQRQHEDAMKEVNHSMSARMKAGQDVKRIAEERNAAVQVCNLRSSTFLCSPFDSGRDDRGPVRTCKNSFRSRRSTSS